MSRERAMAAYVDEKFQPNPLKKKKEVGEAETITFS